MAEKKSSQDGDWDFKVDDEHLEQVELKKKETKASAGGADLLKKRGTGAPKKKRGLGLQEVKKKKKMSRAAIAKRDAALQQHAELMPPNLGPRIMATLIDYGMIAAVYFVTNFILFETLEFHVMEYLRQEGINQTLEPDLFRLAIVAPITVAFGFLFVFFPAFMFMKTPGKMMMKIRVGHPVIGERTTKTVVFIRELIIKPLSVASVLGVLIGIKNEQKRCLHDFICRTALWIDD